jgi:hypothetical protein
MFEYNDLFSYFNEADDEEEKKKNGDKDTEDDKKEDKKSEDKKEDKDDDSDYNDLMDSDKDTEDDESEDYNDLMSDDSEEDISTDDVATDSSDDSDYNDLIGDSSDSNSSCCNVYEKALKAAYASTVVVSNLNYISFKVIGQGLDSTKRIIESLVWNIDNVSRTFYHFASESPLCEIDNPIRAKEHCEDVSVAIENEYEWREALEFIDKNINELLVYIKCLNDMPGLRKDIADVCGCCIGTIERVSNNDIRKTLAGKSSDTSTAVIAVKSESCDYYNDIF